MLSVWLGVYHKCGQSVIIKIAVLAADSDAMAVTVLLAVKVAVAVVRIGKQKRPSCTYTGTCYRNLCLPQNIHF